MAAADSALADLLPGGLAGMLEQARAALDAGPAPEVLELAARLASLEARLEAHCLNLELALEVLARLPHAFNVMSDNLNALTAAASTPLGKLGLRLQLVPKV